MGVDIWLRTKSDSIAKPLSREFLNFTSGPDAYGPVCEYNQVQKILDIDLSIYRESAPNLNEQIEHLEYELWCAEEDNELEKANLIKEQIEKTKEEWKIKAPNDFTGWIKVTELEAITHQFLAKVKATPDLSSKISYNFSWADYFQLSVPDTTYCHRLFIDLENILKILKEVNQYDEQYVTFEVN